MMLVLSCLMNATSGPLRCASYTESHIDGMSPIADEKLLAHDPTVLTCIEYRAKNRPGTRISNRRATALTERVCRSEPRNSLPCRPSRRFRNTNSATKAMNTATASRMVHCAPAGVKLIRLPASAFRKFRSLGRIASYRIDTLKCSMTAMMNVTARNSGVAIQKRLQTISSIRYSTPHSSRFSTATKLRLVHILVTKPQPVSHMLFDNLTRVADWLTPICSAATPMASNTANNTPYSHPGNGPHFFLTLPAGAFGSTVSMFSSSIVSFFTDSFVKCFLHS